MSHDNDKPVPLVWARAATQHREREDVLCLRIELKRILSKLPDPLPQIGRLLMDGASQVQIAAALGHKRGRRVRAWIEQVRAALRQHLYPERAQIG